MWQQRASAIFTKKGAKYGTTGKVLYTQAAMDPTGDCTIWYHGDYIKKDATSYSTKIGAYRLPGCR